MMHSIEKQALEFLVDAGVDTAILVKPHNRFDLPPVIPQTVLSHPVQSSGAVSAHHKTPPQSVPQSMTPLQPHADVIKQAQDLAKAAETLDDLKQAIQDFDGLSVKKGATQIVFSDGNPQADIMVIGEAPGADEDRQGKPFVGVSGQLLDKIFACIGLSREADDPAQSLYISNILNWRPPGNRTPTKEEMEIAFPFVTRHIELINPKILVLCGGVAAQTLLQSKDSISRLRGKPHDYGNGIRAIATYHPAFLLRTPLQKKKVWEDMLMLQDILVS